ncbi:hypothetical protein ABK040_002451 [Willaertia magna]
MQNDEHIYFSSDDENMDNNNVTEMRKVKFAEQLEQSEEFSRRNNEVLIKESDDESDIQIISEKMNEICNLMRSEVMNNLFDMKKKNNQRMVDINQKATDERDELLRQHKMREEKLKDSIAKRDYFLDRFKNLTFRMADQIAHARKVEREKTVLRNILGKWKDHIKEKKVRKSLSKLARRHFEKRIQRTILQGWYMWIVNTKQNTAERIWQNRLETERAEIKNDYEVKVTRLKEEIQKLSQSLEREMNDKQVLQENLKKALMRGVCAMNNKFLEIIKDTNARTSSSINLQQDLEEVLNEQTTVEDEAEFVQTIQNQQPPIPRPYPSFVNMSDVGYMQQQQPLLQQQYINQPTRFVTTPTEAGQIKNPQTQVRVIREAVNFPIKQNLQTPLHPQKTPTKTKPTIIPQQQKVLTTKR